MSQCLTEVCNPLTQVWLPVKKVYQCLSEVAPPLSEESKTVLEMLKVLTGVRYGSEGVPATRLPLGDVEYLLSSRYLERQW